MKDQLYDRQSALDYAKKWALSRNPNYYNFDKIGGDCSNFVSQCIFAGCGVMNFKKDIGWYYINLYNRAAAWSSVSYLHQFITNNQSVGPYAEETDITQLEPGDFIQLGHNNGHWYHSLILMEKKQTELYVSAHSDDAYMRPLSSYSRDKTRYIHIIGFRK